MYNNAILFTTAHRLYIMNIKIILPFLLALSIGNSLWASNIDSMLMVIEKAEKTANTSVLKSTYKTLGDVYFEAKDFQKALESYEQAVPIVERLQEIEEMAAIQQRVATCYHRLHQPETALDILEKATINNKKKLSPATQSSIFNKLSSIYLTLGNPQQAYAYQLKSLPTLGRNGQYARSCLL